MIRTAKVTMAMVSSLDGRSTRGNESGSAWASDEDQAMFRKLIAKSDAVVMGSATYDSVREYIRPSETKPRIILTRQPERYMADAGRPGLEFSSDSPDEVIAKAEARGLKTVLLAGGAATNARFLDAGLVDEIYLTVEPVVFGEGLPLVSPLQKMTTLVLMGCEPLQQHRHAFTSLQCK